MTQLEIARNGKISDEIAEVADNEKLDPEDVRGLVAAGRVVIPRNLAGRSFKILGIGETLRTKVNANIGTSPSNADLEEEKKKLDEAVNAGADAVMDLSTGVDIPGIRAMVLENSRVMVGTVPVYQAAVETYNEGLKIPEMEPDLLFDVIERQCEEGVDFLTVHCGITRRAVKLASDRIAGIVSRGGAMMAAWMAMNDEENPLLTGYDRLLEIVKAHDVTLSLGDALRPGAQADATDRAQVNELNLLGELASRAFVQGVQVMIEGPGHVPLDQVEMNVHLQKRLCHNAPFYVLGPITTDVAPGYDHITSAIGGAVAAAAGADFLCYVTPAEHLKLPTPQDVREGVIAARIAAHTADLVKDVKGARDWDLELSRRRRALDWDGVMELALDPVKALEYRRKSSGSEERTCTMCGEFCAIDMVEQVS